MTTPYSLGSLTPQDPADTNVRRMTPYSTGDQEIPLENNDWKTLGGGIDSNVYDLARFGDRLAAGGVLTRTSLTTMWTKPDTLSAYAYGWDTGIHTDAKSRDHRVVAKGGSQSGVLSHLRVYPDAGITIAVLMNDRSQESGKPLQNPTTLTRDIGALMLNALP
ncbi:serine hydrolase [Actinomadura fulvescens]|uniref:serine hydrolase n=1 Tax=Actinomadura fulvescens TaxID=46160 RepID=UPI0031DA3451